MEVIMALMSWKDEYSVKHDKIDSQHKKLIELINALHAAMKSGKAKDELGNILAKLADYTVIHFRDEEAVQAEANYPKLEEHKKIHADLVSQVVDLKEKFDKGAFMLSLETMTFLKDWLNTHILKEDKAYVSYLK